MVGKCTRNANPCRYDMVATYFANNYFDCCIRYNIDDVYDIAINIYVEEKTEPFHCYTTNTGSVKQSEIERVTVRLEPTIAEVEEYMRETCRKLEKAHYNEVDRDEQLDYLIYKAALETLKREF